MCVCVFVLCMFLHGMHFFMSGYRENWWDTNKNEILTGAAAWGRVSLHLGCVH